MTCPTGYFWQCLMLSGRGREVYSHLVGKAERAVATENDLDPMPAVQKSRNPLPTKSGGRTPDWITSLESSGPECTSCPDWKTLPDTIKQRRAKRRLLCAKAHAELPRGHRPELWAGAHFTSLVYSICLKPRSKSCLRQLEPVTTACIINLQVGKEAHAQLPG